MFFHADGYRDTVLNAINLGGDTDTIAAIAGGIAGIYYGLNDIPEKWVQSIAKKEDLYQMFEKFCYVTNYPEITDAFGCQMPQSISFFMHI